MMRNKAIATALTAIVTISAIAFFFCSGKLKREWRAKQSCSAIVLSTLKGDSFAAIDTSSLMKEIESKESGILGVKIDSLDLNGLETRLKRHKEIKKVDVSLLDNGTLNVKLVSRTPVVRFENSDKMFYADAEGTLFPVRKALPVPIVTGNIREDGLWISSILELSDFLEKNEYWKRSIEQIEILDNGEAVIYTNICNQRFIFGQCTSIDEKFKKMETYFKAIVPGKGKMHYKTVDLRFDRQIVCR